MLTGGQFPSSPPEVDRLLAVLNDHKVRYILVGSVALFVYGVKGEAHDLDIVPALEETNLERRDEMGK